MEQRRDIEEAFVRLGRRLGDFGREERSRRVIGEACAANGWFTPGDIAGAVEAIRANMLEEETLRAWLASYPTPAASRNVLVVMAGNIPLVGFHDLLCVLASGHRCLFKPSSKDGALMRHVVSLLREVWPDAPAEEYAGQAADAVIATGSANTNRYFRSRYRSLPSLLRGNRASVAVLTGSETPEQLDGLARDIFSYSGLGCRNVSHLLLPEGYDVRTLVAPLSAYGPVNPKLVNNFRQRSALLRMQGAATIDGPFFTLRRDSDFPAATSEITWREYAGAAEAQSWLEAVDEQLQCVVHDPSRSGVVHPRSAGFGRAQEPSLADYADGRDTMLFLREDWIASLDARNDETK